MERHFTRKFFRTRGKYGEGSSEERFTYTLALVFVQCVVNYLYAIVSTRYILRQTGEDTTKSSYYAICPSPTSLPW